MDSQSCATLQSFSQYSESLRTTSTRSAYSVDREKDRDLTKDNVLSPVDLECLIQAERLTKILDETVYKTKLALCLPNLVQEFNTLNSILSTENMDDLIVIFDQYDRPLVSGSFLNVDAMEDIKNGAITLKNRINPEVAHIIYIINSYQSLKPIVEKMIQGEKLKYDTENTKMPHGLEYLCTLEQFRDLMVTQLNTTADEELVWKLNTKKMQKANDKLLASIDELNDKLREEGAKYNATIVVKKQNIEDLEFECRSIKQDASLKLQQKIVDSEYDMVMMSRDHTVKNEMLAEEEAEARKAYEQMFSSHMKDEKYLRKRRFKVETQLTTWIQKYDLEMGDKQLELDEFQEKYLNEMRKCEELKEKLALQDLEYIPLMAEREEEYHREMAEKCQKFLLEHAARTIQKAWRETLAVRAEKKKLRKMLKKHKDAEMPIHKTPKKNKKQGKKRLS